MSTAIDVERALRRKSTQYCLKPNDAAKADVWKHFSLVCQLKSSEPESDESIEHVKYLCACKKCLKVYNYKAKDGSSYGTKNLLDHLKSCQTVAGQPTNQNCLYKKTTLKQSDKESVKNSLVHYCIDGYQSFRASRTSWSSTTACGSRSEVRQVQR